MLTYYEKKVKNCDGQQFHQYQQNKRKLKEWWSTIPPISTKQKKVKNSDGQQFHQYQQNKQTTACLKSLN